MRMRGQQVGIIEQVRNSTQIGEIYTSATSSEANGEIAEFTIIIEWSETNGDKVNDLYYDRDVLLKWITSIPSDKKFIYTTTFEIREKRK